MLKAKHRGGLELDHTVKIGVCCLYAACMVDATGKGVKSASMETGKIASGICCVTLSFLFGCLLTALPYLRSSRHWHTSLLDFTVIDGYHSIYDI
jgi:hypothetical protein